MNASNRPQVTLGWSVQPRENVKENDGGLLTPTTLGSAGLTGLTGSSGLDGGAKLGHRNNKDLHGSALKENTNSIISCSKETWK
jgi:hypothetical protein